MSSVSFDFNPCVSCGACCAFFRAAFYWGEADDCEGGTVPVELVEDLPPYRRAMQGTNNPEPRCTALRGEIGQCVSCAIYEKRSSTCRAFPFSWEDGQHNPDCDKARAKWGLAPLTQPAFATVELHSTPDALPAVPTLSLPPQDADAAASAHSDLGSPPSRPRSR
ncbi:MAG: YkgJ family cysteine cluster protein [Myxococcales bacterium]|nr:YkgJ family cysteine cluster protein [Myxococcales bacterium]